MTASLRLRTDESGGLGGRRDVPAFLDVESTAAWLRGFDMLELRTALDGIDPSVALWRTSDAELVGRLAGTADRDGPLPAAAAHRRSSAAWAGGDSAAA